MRRIPAVLLILVLLAGTALPARAAESPPRSPIDAAQVFADLWHLFLSLFADLGSDMDSDGLPSSNGDLGSEMDPDG
jgi:hypothetical protein